MSYSILILLLQKSCLERKESLKLKSTQISISFRRKSSLMSCLVESCFSKFPRKTNFPPHCERKKSPNECHDVQHFLTTITIVSNHFRPFDFGFFPSQRNLKSKTFISFNDLKHVRNEDKM